MISYKKDMNSIIDEINAISLENIDEIKSLYRKLVCEMLNEECIVYIDKINKTNAMIEVHFEDCNFYEIEFSKEDTADNIIKKIQDNLVIERMKDKQDRSINGNNRRYSQNKVNVSKILEVN